MKEHVFKIMRERDGRLLREIPLRVIAPCQEQVLTNHNQSLSRLNQRGGLTAKEALHVLYGLRWYASDESSRIQCLTQEEADQELGRVVKERYAQLIEAEKRAAEDRRACTHDRPGSLTGDATGAKRCKKCGCLVFEGA